MSVCFSHCLLSQPLPQMSHAWCHYLSHLKLCARFWIISSHGRGCHIPRGILTHFLHRALPLPQPASPLPSLAWFYRLGSKAQRWNSLLTVAAEAEDTFLQSIQGHEADVLKHVQPSATPWRQAQPLVLGRKIDSDIVGSWLPETLPNPNHNGQTSLLESPPQMPDPRDNPNWVTVEVFTITVAKTGSGVLSSRRSSDSHALFSLSQSIFLS